MNAPHRPPLSHAERDAAILEICDWQLPRQIAAAKARVAMLEREREEL